MKSAPFVSPNFLERLAEPESPLHPDYLAYRRSEITRAQLVNRLPHVAILGDSVCTSVYISSPWGTLWRAHTSRGKNWFLHLDAAPSICSISKSLEAITAFVAIECAGVGALVDHEHCRQNLLRRILGTRNFSGQVGELLQARRFPDLILICIGHNNVDWAWRCPQHELDTPEERLPRLSEEFRQNYARELRRLLEGARIQQHRVAIVVYGLIDFESYFKGREAAERLQESDTTLYPLLGNRSPRCFRCAIVSRIMRWPKCPCRTCNSSEPCHVWWIASISAGGAIESNSPVTNRIRVGSQTGRPCKGELR